ncbi:MAG: trypsin-like serine protease [Acidobacteria bacterium]|nr:trypsin-like serine protease [Acidobacteriota bacterium]
MLTRRRAILSLLLLLCGFASGLVITGRMRNSTDAAAQKPAPAAATAPAVQNGIAGAATAFPDFTRVAERTVPAVANISSTQVVRRPNSPYSNDPFFQYFFGNQDDVFGSRRGVQSSLGSGVIISADGYILTNNHVVAGESGRISLRQLPAITVSLEDKREMKADIIGVDPATDLALLKIAAKDLRVMPWGDSSKLKVAEWVLAIGNPFQLNETVTLGIVSALGRKNVGISEYEDFIQTDAAINPGNSGGALVNVRGELIGINTAIFSQSGGYQGIGFAVPSNLARRVVDELQKYGEVRRGSIGYVEIAPLTAEMAAQLSVQAGSGLLVQGMRRDSSAYQAGIRPGDVIVSFNGTAVTDGGQLSRLIQDTKIASTAVVVVIRDAKKLELKISIQSTAQ